ncbi:MAG: Gfo/Idh/MocA family oxidoreductase [Armatimonadetes bacterium]|nr:Gfo/Idh/MocA family oxidoreductase [Armatimonadota bacterium]
MRNGKVRVGLVGCGVMGKSLATQLRTIEQMELVAACDAFDDVSKAFAEEFGIWSTTNLDELLGRDDIDAVLIATPPYLHAEQTVAAAKAGKHVFCEKPMALTVEDCDRMIEACQAKNVKLMVGQVLRYFPIHSKVKEIVESGELGRLLCLTIHRLGGWFTGVWAKDWRKSKVTSGGALMEVNIHELDYLRWVGGEVESVFAMGENFLHSDCDYPDCALVVMKFQNGALGILHTSQVSIAGDYGGRADCEKGSLLFPQFWNGKLVVQTEREQKVIKAEELSTENPVRRELREFVESIVENRKPAITGEDGRAAVALAVAIYKSMETGNPISLRFKQ